MSFEIFTYGNPDAAAQLVQMVDDHDLSLIEQEVEFIRELSGGQDFGLKAVKVDSWNRDLSPWPAPAVFGNEDFGEGAVETLAFLLDNVVPAGKAPGAKTFLGGYSLAGLFALWAGYRTDRFDGIICGLHARERDAAARSLSESGRPGGADEKPGDVAGWKRDPAGLRRAAGSGSGVRAGVE